MKAHKLEPESPMEVGLRSPTTESHHYLSTRVFEKSREHSTKSSLWLPLMDLVHFARRSFSRTHRAIPFTNLLGKFEPTSRKRSPATRGRFNNATTTRYTANPDKKRCSRNVRSFCRGKLSTKLFSLYLQEGDKLREPIAINLAFCSAIP